MAAADFDLIQIPDKDPYLDTPEQADEPAETPRSHTAAVMDTDKTPSMSS